MTRSVCIALAFCASFSTGAYAGSYVNPQQPPKTNPLKGIYLGVQLGNSQTHYGLSGFDTDTGGTENGTVTSSGFGESGLLGYKFNRYFATEAGYTHYGTTNASDLTYSDGNQNKSGEITENSVDLAIKGIWPLAKEVDLYGKIGAAYLWTHTKITTGYSKNRSTVKPLVAIGADYNISDNFVFDVSYNHIQSNSTIKSADLIGVGFYYYF